MDTPIVQHVHALLGGDIHSWLQPNGSRRLLWNMVLVAAVGLALHPPNRTQEHAHLSHGLYRFRLVAHRHLQIPAHAHSTRRETPQVRCGPSRATLLLHHVCLVLLQVLLVVFGEGAQVH